MDVTAQVFEQLCIAITDPETHFGLTGQVDGVEDVLVPESRKEQHSVQLDKNHFIHLC